MRNSQDGLREDEQVGTGLLRSVRDATGRVVVVLSVAILCWGCSNDSEIESSGGTAETAAKRKHRRNEVLKTLVEMSQPEALRIQTRRETVVSLLNDWVSMGGESFKTVDPVDKVYTGRIDESLIGRIAAVRFSNRDVTHIRDSLWYARISKLVASAATTDLERATRLFFYVTRNIVLRSDEDTSLPLAPFGVAMFGEGNSRDRAWLFVSLLRQLRIDAVVLQAADSTNDVLVGVLLDGKVYLYDPRIGLPVPVEKSTAKTGLIGRPATLSEALQEPSLLESLSPSKDTPYRFSAESLAEVRVLLVGATSYWAPRMRRLQLALSSDDDVLLWQPLEASEIVPEGALARVAKVKAKGFDEATIAIWDYPEQRLDGNADLDTKQLQVFSLRSRAFEAPIPVERILANQETRDVRLKVAERGQFRHQKSRNRQLLGDWKMAVTTFLKIRMWRDVPPLPKEVGFIDQREQVALKAMLPTRVRLVHAEAADDAAFWTAVCQYELGQVQSAADALHEYCERSGPHEWESGAVWLEGLWRGELKQWAKAVAVLETIDEDDPHWAGARVLLARWKPLAAAGGEPAPGKPGQSEGSE